jgi:tetratricopeptide (TPR) repeat protein
MPKDSAELTEPNLVGTLAAGLAHHQAGQLAAAEAAYRSVLARDPEQPSALYLCGVLLLATGRTAEAERLLAAAAAVRPDHTESCFAHANALQRKGDRTGAIGRYRALLAHWPDHAGAHVNLSNCLREAGDARAALAAAETACRLVPASAPAETTRGAALLAQRRFDEAIAAYRAGVEADPQHAPAHAGLAASLLHAERPAEALAAAESALLLAPEFADAEFLRAMALARLDADPAAIAGLERTIACDPTHAKAHLNLGNLLSNCDRIHEAEKNCRRAIALDPTLVEAHASLGHLLTAAGRPAEAIAACEAALALDPEFVQAHWNQAIALLLTGDYARGWEKYEARKGYDRFVRLYPDPAGPVWRGEPLAGRSILVVAEQGLGDTIQFARYLPLLAAQGARVLLACDAPLVPLFADQPRRAVGAQLGLAAVFPRRNEKYPPYDVWVTQMSLPYRFQTRLDTIPSPGRILAADPARVRRWHECLPSGPRIGIVWAGNPRHTNDARRSIPVTHLAPLLGTAGVPFVSLQTGPRAADAAALPGLLDVAAGLVDFAETAALIEALDLVLSVDTSTAHCSAALGKETWIMLPHAPDWRWLIGREDSPWYSAVRLFRQPAPGAWDDVLARVQNALGERRSRGLATGPRARNNPLSE